MAVGTVDVLLSGPDWVIRVRGPDFVFHLLRDCLSGWEMVRQEVPLGSVDIAIDLDPAGTLTVTCGSVTETSTDPVHALNHTINALGLSIMKHLPGWDLLHCAAYRKNGQNVLVLGDYNSGKSSLALRESLDGGELVADDLLIWNQRTAVFMALGLAARMRRPVPSDIMQRFDQDAFVTGATLAYLKPTRMCCAPAGDRFEPDRVLWKEPHLPASELPLANYFKLISKRSILHRNGAVRPTLSKWWAFLQRRHRSD